MDGAVVMYVTFHTAATPKPHQRETKTKPNQTKATPKRANDKTGA